MPQLKRKKKELEKNHEEEKAKILSDKLEKEKNKKEESFKNYSEQVSKNENVDEEKISSLNKFKEEEMKRESEKKAENSNPNLPQKGDSFDEKTKSKYTQEAERELKKHSISDQKLNQKLGVDDWKNEMNKM